MPKPTQTISTALPYHTFEEVQLQHDENINIFVVGKKKSTLPFNGNWVAAVILTYNYHLHIFERIVSIEGLGKAGSQP